MSFLDVLQACRRDGIRLVAKDGKLLLGGGADKLTPALRADLQRHKAEILAWLAADEAGEAPIPRQPARERYPLSYSQQRLWFIDQLEGGSPQYNLPSAFGLRGALDEAALQTALDAVVARHAVLRTLFAEDEGAPVQRVLPPQAVTLTRVDLAALAPEQQKAKVEELAAAEAARPFDLAQGPMLRCSLIRRGPDSHVVLFTLHHIAADGWSMGVLVQEFAALYAAALAQRPAPLPELPLQYADYACWQRQGLEDGALRQSLDYWTAQLAGMPVVHALPLEQPRPPQQRFAAQRHGQYIDRAKLDALRALAQAHGATLFMLLQAAYAFTLSRFSGERDIVVGVPNAGRGRKELEPLIGFFINTLVFRSAIDDGASVAEYLAAARRTALDAFAHAEVPFDLLVDTLKHPRSLAYNPLCQVKFVLQNHHEGKLALPGLELEPLGQGEERLHFDLDLSCAESDIGLHLSWLFKEDLFARARIERMARAYERVLDGMLASADTPMGALQWADPADTAAALALGQGPDSERFRAASLPEQIAQQAARTPQAVAVRQGETTLSYAALQAKAERLAQLLAEQGVQPGERVGVHLERCAELPIALLGVLRSGAAYVMLDPQQPPERLARIVADAGLRVVLLDSRRAVVPPAGLDLIYLDDAAADADWLADYAGAAAAVAIAPDDSAYVLYTSGSTGAPKGVEIAHRGLTDYCAFAREGYYTDDLAGSLVLTSPAFDLSIPSLYVPLLCGGTVELMPAQEEIAAVVARLDGDALASLLRMTPSHAQALLALADAQPRATRHVFVIGGEAFEPALAQALQAKFPQARLYNHYGPTETVVGCCWYDVSAHLAELGAAIPIGRPMPNTRLYVLDAQGRALPAGIAGELAIGGAGVAKGYLHQPELTAQKFIADPFRAGERLYRSGDRVRWNAQGELEFLGRLDDQVKLRGFRIELGEIQSVLAAVDGVREAVVAVQGEATLARLVGYLVPTLAQDAEAGAALLERAKAAAAAQLPAYMQPQAYVVLERLPRTPNGKLDRRALPLPEQTERADVAPQTETERELAEIWSRLLQRTGIGRHAHFFDLGGHSLLATRVASEIGKRFGKPVPVRALFEHPTLLALAAHVDAQRREGYAPIPPAERGGALPVSFAQQRLWFIDRLEGGSVQYNMPVALRLRGRLDRAALQGALDALVARHEVLRSVYAEQDGDAVQVVRAARAVPLALDDLRELDAADGERALQALALAEANRAFDLAEDLMLRVRLALLGEDDQALLFTMHHIASDGWSMGVLVQEFTRLYAAFAAGAEPLLPALPIQYADYAAWQRERLQGETLQQHLGYWRTQLAGLPAVHALPLDFPRPPRQRFHGASVDRRLDAATLQALHALARHHGASLFMLLQAAFAVLVARWSGETDIVVGTPIAGRLHPDVEPLIGFFVNTLVLRTDLSDDPDFATLLERSKATALAAYAHQEVPFETLVEELKPARSLAHTPLFQLLFSLRNTEQGELSLPGLEIAPWMATGEQAKFDLQLAATETPQGLQLNWLYATSLFEAASIARLADAFLRLLRAIAADARTKVLRLPLIAETDVAQLAAWNATARPFLEDACVHALIEAQAAHQPEAVAVICGEERLSFAELERRANRVAQRLHALGLQPDERVALCLPRGTALAVGLLGVLKAGGAYVPLDPTLPPDRLAFLVEDSAPCAVLTLAAVAGALPRGGVPRLHLDDVAQWPEAATPPVVAGLHSRRLAYVLYTSGSTGQPKGVMVEHRGLVNYLEAAAQAYLHDGVQGALVATTFGFDATVTSLLLPWLAGKPCVLLPEDTQACLAALLAHAAAPAPWLFKLTPAHLDALAHLHEGAPSSTRHVLVVGGEALTRRSLARLRERLLPEALVINEYGPTETVVGCTTFVCDNYTDRSAGDAVPIGRPLPNTRIRLLDALGQDVPVGVVGEIHIGGAQVARGYWNRPALTDERFLRDAEGQRWYRSGDLARWRADGELEYLGRNDFQVKLRGFRIELGEIEAALAQCEGVREAVVVARTDAPGDTRLVAYAVAEAGAALDVAVLRSALARALADYMLPAAILVLDALPLTANGKIDRRALPAPEWTPAEYVAPQTPTEAALAETWAGVLRLERVSRDAHFFELGGHSLLATRVVSELARRLGKRVPVRALFERPRLDDLAALVDTLARGDTASIPRADRTRALPLSFAQQRLWFIDRLEGGSAQYNLPLALRLQGRLDEAALQRALDAVVARHEVLRTGYAEVDGEAVQVVHTAAPLAIACEDWRGRELDTAAQTAGLAALAQREAAQPFDLAQDWPLRARRVALAQDDHALLVTLHHIAADGWSLGVLVREFGALYAAFAEGREATLPDLPIQYADYAAWQRERLAGAGLQGQLDYWRAQLDGAPAVHALPLDRARPPQQDFAGAALEGQLDLATLERLQALARQRGASLFMLLHAAFAALLARWSGETDIVVGTPVAGRLHSDVEPLIGLFLNTLALRSDLAGDPSFDTLLEQAKATALDAFAHQDLPFEMLVEALQPARSLQHTPLFQISFTMQNNEAVEANLPGLRLSSLQGEAATAKFDLQLLATETPQGLRYAFVYATSLFERASIARLSEAFALLLRQIAQAPQTRLSQFALIGADDTQRLAQWNATARAYPREETLAALFQAQAARTPAAIALQQDAQQLSYAELDAAANRIAHFLVEQGLRPDGVVAVCAERSLDFVVGMLGVLKAGGAYLPIDPQFPEERIAYLLDDAAIEIVLTPREVLAQLPFLSERQVLPLDAPLREAYLADYPDTPVDLASRGVSSRHLAYVIYTSGSTGQPKGVMVEQRSVTRLVKGTDYAPVGPGSCVAHCANPAFDASTWEVWSALLNGAKVLVIPPATVLEPVALRDALIAGGVTALWLTVGLFNEVLDVLGPAFAKLDHLLIGGDALDPRRVGQLLASEFRPKHLVNGYGPTETTTFAATHDIEHANGRSIPIGKPIANTQIYILDAQGQPVPVGVQGELYIGGDGVARGYLNQPQLTQERFVADPFSGDASAKLYKTGDLGRWLPDGTIEYLGRNDFQVKLRGFRIELGEIDAAIARQDGVAEVLTTLLGEGADKQIVAYVAARTADAAESAALAATLRRRLAAELPAYMVPGAFVVLERLPLTANGKVDRRALPAPAPQEAAYVAPQGETETRLAAIWARVLKHATVSREANFFDLGGHSLLATRVTSEIAREFGKPVLVRALFEHPSVQALAAWLDTQAQQGHAVIPRVPRDGALPLSFAQQRLWFIDRLEGASPQYNMPGALRLSGALDVAALQHALEALAARHEVLRTVFAEVEGEAVQIVRPAGPLPLAQDDLRALEPAEREARLKALTQEEGRRPFDLSRDPMLRLRLVRLDEAEHALLFTLHHIAADGWSMGVLVREFTALYAGFAAGAAPALPPLPVQYADYAVWQRARLQPEALSAHLDYWRTQLRDLPVLHNLPLDKPRPPRQRFAAGAVEQQLDAATLQRLHALAREHGASLFMLLQAAFAVLLARWSGEEDIVVGTPIAGRLHQDVEPLIGFFLNTLVLRHDLSGAPAFAELLARTRDTVLDAYSHQEVPFEMLVDALKPERHLGHSALYQVVLVLQNFEPSEAALPGLRIGAMEAETARIDIDLNLTVVESADGLRLRWLYAQSLFEADTIARLAESFGVLVQGLLDAPHTPVTALPLLPQQDRAALAQWHTARAEPRPELCAHSLFEAQVRRTPQAPALFFEGASLSYAELNAEANRVAHYLLAQGVQRDERVGLCAARSLDLMVGLLGILKAGAAYLPLDPTLPEARIAAMLADAQVRSVLSQSDVLEALPRLDDYAVLPLDPPLRTALLAGFAEHDPEPAALGLTPRHLAYTVYTSGSTGEPKGVLIEHRGLVNLVLSQHPLYGVGPGSRALAFASIGFDAAASEWLMALVSGATLYLCDQEERRSPARLAEYLERHRITHATLPPVVLAQLPRERAYAFEALLVAGEACEESLAWAWAERYRLCNAYGPSEGSVAATSAEIRPGEPITLGQALPNVELLVLNAALQPQPIGVAGELYLGGMGLARGYLNRPELSAEKFIAHPLREGERLYRTGDLVCRLADGTLRFLGRADHQVKIRGFRIELGEIEARLRRHPAVREVVAVAREDAPGQRRVVAYVVGADPEAAEGALAKQWRRFLAQQLPDYMIPAAFVLLERLPVSRNGKVERSRLPAPRAHAADSAFVAPQTPTELRLAQLWSGLLDQAAIERDAHFFELGGHSLLAARMIGEIASLFGKDLTVRAAFEHPTLRALAAHVDAQVAQGYAPIAPVARTQALPLSFAQQRLWFLDRLDPAAGAAYHIPMGLRLHGALDTAALAQALDAIVARHEILRTRFVETDGTPLQTIEPETTGFALTADDLADLAAPQREARVAELAAQEARAPFDLARGPLLRGRLLRLGEDEHVLLITQHHIVSDGWSLGVLVREFCELYAAYGEGRAAALAPLPLQYADYAAWQRGNAQLAEQLDFWREHLRGAPALLTLPTDRPRPPLQSYAGASIPVHVPAALTQALQALAQRHGATLFMTLMAGWSLLMARLSGQDDVVVGTPVANRQRAELAPLIGFFVNTLALRVRHDASASVEALLAQVKRTTLDAYAHQDAPFEQVVEAVQPQRSLAHSPLFQTMLSLNNTPRGETQSLPGLRVSALAAPHATTQFDLTLSLSETGNGLAGALEYASDLFEPATLQRWLAHFQTLLRGLVAGDAPAALALPLWDEDARAAAWATAAAGPRLAPPPTSLAALFEAQVRRTPQAEAVRHEAESLSFDALNRRANRIARRLHALGVGAEDRVALCAERGVDAIAAVLAVWKAGAAYLPMDPRQPPARLAHVLHDAQPAVLLTQAALAAQLEPLAALPQILLDDADLAGDDDLGLAARPDQLAYVIYTSGSTGQPKGVMVEQAGVVNLWQAFEHEVFAPLAPNARVALDAGLWFDASLQSLVQLFSGRCVVVVPEALRTDAHGMVAFVRDENVAVVDCTPAQFELFAGAGLLDPAQAWPHTVLIGGEAISAAAWERAAASSRACFNVYGPTECTVDASVARIAPGVAPHLGEPIANTRLHVLDARGEPVPDGVAGELCIAGAGVARGYLGRGALTAERFLADPAQPGGRLYRSGDLVRRRGDGRLDYLGRGDAQVKLRGFRIELGEIEARLARCAGVREAVVVLREDAGDRRLVAYLTPQAGAALDAAALRARLAAQLADYMLPAAFVVLDALPLTPNGKLDRARLPAPERGDAARRGYVAPQGEAELALAQLWQELLGVAQVGREDEFFELGGHSLLAVNLVARMAQRHPGRVAVRDLFRHRRLRDLAAFWCGSGAEAASPLVTVDGHAGGALYLVPGAGLTAAAYLPLARALRGRLGVHVFEPPGFDQRRAPVADMAALVRENLAALRAQQPQGPYCLAGHSFGGAVAFEMACALEAQGEQATLLLLDSVLHLREDQRGVDASATAWIERLLGEAGGGDVAQGMARLGLGDAAGGLDRYTAALQAQMDLYDAYAPAARFGGRCRVLRARDGAVAAMAEEALRAHLAPHLAAPPAFADVAGGHLSMLAPAHAAALAEAIAQSVRDAAKATA